MRHRAIGVAVGILLWTGILPGQDGPPLNTRECAISGRVVNGSTSEPIRGATVQLADASHSAPDLISSVDFLVIGKSPNARSADLKTESLNDGSFCFQAVKRGQYALNASKPGFIDSYYGATSYSQVGSVLIVEDKGVEGIAVQLLPMSGIVGRIVDDRGDAVERANVVAVKAGWYQGRQVFMPVQGTLSDERGEYRIGKLTAGTYFVYAQPGLVSPTAGSSLPLVRSYYPSALSLAEATVINVPPGKDAHGINIRMINTNTYHVRGRLQGPTDQWVGGFVQLLPRQEERMVLIIGAASNLSSDGSFDFPNVSPGLYKLSFRSAAGGSQLDVDVRRSDAFLNVPVSGNAVLRGSVVVDPLSGSRSATMPKIALKPADALVGPTYQLSISSGGDLKAEGISPGKYFLNISPPAGEFVKSITAAGSELSSWELDLTAGGIVDLAILMRVGSATLRGSIVGAGQATATARGHIVAIASPPKSDGSGVYFAASDSTGRFAISNLPPSKYRVCALQSVDTQMFQNPSLLKQLADIGTEVELQEKESRSIELPLLSSDVLEQHVPLAAPGN